MFTARNSTATSSIALLLITSLLAACQLNPKDGETATGIDVLDPPAEGETLTPSADVLTTAPVLSPRPLELELCYSSVSNPPKTDGLQVIRQSAVACRNGVQMLVAPAQGSCLTSGYGYRKSSSGEEKFHVGFDYQGPGKTSAPVLAAADGIVIINNFRNKDLGNWLVIDHGNDIYTGYGHLKSKPEFSVGDTVKQGEELAMMGSTGLAAGGRIHLHVEYRTGKLSNIAAGGYFLLDHFNPYDDPNSCPPV